MKAIKKIKEYLLLNEIGRGSFGKVYEALSEKTNKLYAIKALANENFKNPRLMELLKKELKILFSLNHQNIIKIIGVEKTINNVYLILEYCNGGTLLDYITYYKRTFNRNLPEEIIQMIMKQIIDGLRYMHKNNVVHRDIKLENILINFDDLEVEFKFEKKESGDDVDLNKNTKYFQNLNEFINSRHESHLMHKTYSNRNLLEDKYSIKIADLGYARILNQSEASTTICGTPLFMAPDIINLINKENENKNYNSSIDIWSLGTVFYELLIGTPPFTATYDNEIFKKILAGVYKIPKNLKLSVEALSFLNALMEFYPEKRCKINELDSHPFIKRDVKDFTYIYTDNLEDEDPNTPFITIDSKETSSLLLKIIKYFKIELPEEELEKKVLYQMIEDKVINRIFDPKEKKDLSEALSDLKGSHSNEELIIIVTSKVNNCEEIGSKTDADLSDLGKKEGKTEYNNNLEELKKSIQSPIKERFSQGTQIQENSEKGTNALQENQSSNDLDENKKKIVEVQISLDDRSSDKNCNFKLANHSDYQEYDEEFKNFILIKEFKEEIDEDGFCHVGKDN